MPVVITCAAALNLCFNVSGVELPFESILTHLECFDDNFTTKAKERFTGYFQGLYNTYYLKYGNPTTQSTSAASSSTQSGDFEEDILEEVMQDNEAIPLWDEEIALDEAASEAMSNGSGSVGEDVDLTLSESE
ncbi:hypothetical protein Tco_0701892 [Tanacetum coccineum]|uniref:Uncharacterized protein n=1 Tax=Tanacetum coccineum TaxID=301880 RepID=A0ABQ4XVB8_9ASTR